jgi:tRNA pseudouridine38-40 synthase
VVRIVLGVEYDGRAFCGWQTQPQGCAVQDALERALEGVAAHPVKTTAAGRTDAGVHATGQVVHFDTLAVRPLSAWVRGVNALSPQALCVLWAREMDETFHARFAALSRTYRYLLLNRPVRPAVASARVGWYHRPLDIDAMRRAAKPLLGEHDFSAFRAAQCQAKSPIRTLSVAGVSAQGDLVTLAFTANAFLHHMVRNIVGSLIYVGNGNHAPQWMAELLRSRDRKLAAPTVGPEGLYLTRVEYSAQWGLSQSETSSAVFLDIDTALK